MELSEPLSSAFFCPMLVSTIAVDLDGTLLDDSGAVSARNRRALEAAGAAGINRPLDGGELASVAEAVQSCRLHGICCTGRGILMDDGCPALPRYRRRDQALGGGLRLSVTADAFSAVARRGEVLLKVMVNSFEEAAFDALDARLAYHSARIDAVEAHPYMRCGLSRLPESKDPEDHQLFFPWSIVKGLLPDCNAGCLSGGMIRADRPSAAPPAALARQGRLRAEVRFAIQAEGLG